MPNDEVKERRSGMERRGWNYHMPVTAAAPGVVYTGAAPAPDLSGYSLLNITAAPEAYSRDYAEGRARGRAEGLEEAALELDAYACDAEDDKLDNVLSYLATAIRAKIKPTRGS